MIRSFCRARAVRPREEGFVLFSVLVLAILYFALIALILWESTFALRGAQRFRSRVIAQTMAESAAELSAKNFPLGQGSKVEIETDEGVMRATSEVVLADPPRFTIVASATTSGVSPATATVKVWGHFEGPDPVIDRTEHSQ